MATFLHYIVAVLFTLSIVGIIIQHTWFPATSNLRICKKKKGQYSYYRSEVYRPFFGWSPFYADKYTGEIIYTTKWTISKQECINSINIYKKLKNVINYDEEYYNQDQQ